MVVKKPNRMACDLHDTSCRVSILADGSEYHHRRARAIVDPAWGRLPHESGEFCQECRDEIKPGKYIHEYFALWKNETTGEIEMDSVGVAFCTECDKLLSTAEEHHDKKEAMVGAFAAKLMELQS